jgi:hypothetical protein
MFGVTDPLGSSGAAEPAFLATGVERRGRAEARTPIEENSDERLASEISFLGSLQLASLVELNRNRELLLV